MPTSDALKKAKLRYRSKVKTLRVDLYPTDADIIAKLEERIQSGEAKAAYIKRLIREDISK